MGHDELVRKLRLQLRIERTIIAFVVLFFVGRWAYGFVQNRHYAIYSAGKPVAVLATRESAQRVLQSVKRSANPSSPEDVYFVSSVNVRRVSSSEEPVSEARAVDAVNAKVHLRISKYAILIDGKPVVAVNSEEDAGAVLEAAKQRYGSIVKNLMEEPAFKQDVQVRKMPVDDEMYKPNVDQALDSVLSGQSGSGVYTVVEGDIASSIAEKFHMKLSDLQALNGGKDLDRLQIGENIRVSMKSGGEEKPKLVVVVRDQETGSEVIPYQTETVSSMQLKPGKQVELNPGSNGLRNVVRAVTYENGVRSGMEVVEEKLIRNAVPRRIAVGISH